MMEGVTAKPATMVAMAGAEEKPSFVMAWSEVGAWLKVGVEGRCRTWAQTWAKVGVRERSSGSESEFKVGIGIQVWVEVGVQVQNQPGFRVVAWVLVLGSRFVTLLVPGGRTALYESAGVGFVPVLVLRDEGALPAGCKNDREAVLL